MPTLRCASRSLVACPLLLACSSCFTAHVWGFALEDDVDPATGQSETAMGYDERTRWSWESVGLRVLLTPFALALDCVTCPVQAVVFWSDDTDDCGRGR